MLGNIKIRIKNPEHSACVQKKLFEMGFEWGDYLAAKSVQNELAAYLYTLNSSIIYGCSGSFPLAV